MLAEEDIMIIKRLIKNEFKEEAMKSSDIRSGNCYNHLPSMSKLKEYMLDNLLPYMKSYDTYKVWDDIRRLVLHVYKFNRMSDLIDKPNEESIIASLGKKIVDDIKESLDKTRGMSNECDD